MKNLGRARVFLREANDARTNGSGILQRKGPENKPWISESLERPWPPLPILG